MSKILWRKLILALIVTLISEKDAIEELVLKSNNPKYIYRTEWYDQQVIESSNFIRKMDFGYNLHQFI